MHSPTEIVARAVEMGCPAVALTDHGDCGGHIEFLKAARDAGIKPILGLEAYMCDDSTKKDANHNKRFHVNLWAQNQIGLQNIWALSTKGYVDGYYYKPRIDWEMLYEHREGVICGSACLGGYFGQDIKAGNFDELDEHVKLFQTIFGDRMFIELHANSLPEQKPINAALVAVAAQHGIPVTFACDAHYNKKEDWEHHEALLGIQTRNTMNDEGRWSWLNDYYMMTEHEVRARLSYLGDDVVQRAIDGSLLLASMVEDSITLDDSIKLPQIDPPEWFVGSNNQYLAHLCFTNFQKLLMGHDVLGTEGGRFVVSEQPVRSVPPINMDVYGERLHYELDFIIKHKLTEYFMVVSDYTLWARGRMLVGPARGSAGGSLVAYLAGITTIDPIKYDLPFERFLNEGRLGSLPDIDLDFPTVERSDVKDYMEEKYGKDKVSSIGTIGRLGAKQAVKDACFYLESRADAMLNKVFDSIPSTEGLVTWEDYVEALPNQSDIDLLRSKPQLYALAGKLMGVARQSGSHAAGVIVSPVPLAPLMPLRTKKGEITTQFDMRSVEALGFLKVDLLGLRTLSTLQDAVRLIEQRHGVKIDFTHFSDEQICDQGMWQMLRDGKTLGVFQAETTGITGVLKKMQPDKVEDLSAAIALYRPGVLKSKMDNGKNMVEEYLARRAGESPVVYDDPRLEAIIGDTFGILVYQEQVMKISQVIAGYTPVEADTMRSILGKKKFAKMAAEHDKFIGGAIANGMDSSVAEKLWDNLAKFASYGFNKAHSLAYAMLGVWCAYIKFHYPEEMMCALLNTDPLKVSAYIKECGRLGIKVKPPRVNSSQDEFSIDENGAIVFGTLALKGLGDKAAASIKANRPYESVEDFLYKNSAGDVNSAHIKSLIRVNAFEGLTLGGREVGAEYLLETFTNGAKKKTKKGEPSRWTIPVPAEDEDCSAEFSSADVMKNEQDCMGTLVSGDALSPYLDDSSDLQFATLYDVDLAPTGSTFLMAGIITRVKEIITKKGDAMAFVEINNHVGDEIDFAVFPEDWAKKGDQLAEGSPLFLTVKKNARKDGRDSLVLVDTFAPPVRREV